MNSFVKTVIGIVIISLLFIQGCSYSKSSIIKQYDSVTAIKIPRAEYLWLKAEGIYVPKYYLYNDTKFIENTFRYDTPENTIYAYLSAIVNKDWGTYVNSFTEGRRELEFEAQRAIGDLPEGVIVNYSIKYNNKDKITYDVLVEERWGFDEKIDDSPLIEHIILKNMNGTWKIDFVTPYNHKFIEHVSSGESEKLLSFQTKDNDCKRQVLDKELPLKHCTVFYVNEGRSIIVYGVDSNFFDLDGDNASDVTQLSIYENGYGGDYALFFNLYGYGSPFLDFNVSKVLKNGTNLINVNVTPLSIYNFYESHDKRDYTDINFLYNNEVKYSKRLYISHGNAIVDLVKVLNITDSMTYLNGTYLLNVTVSFTSALNYNYTLSICFDPTLTMSDPDSGYEFVDGYKRYYCDQYDYNISSKKGINYAYFLIDLNKIADDDKEIIKKFDKLHFNVDGVYIDSMNKDGYSTVQRYSYNTAYYDAKKLLSKS